MESLKKLERFLRQTLRTKRGRQLKTLLQGTEALEAALQRQLILSAGFEVQRVRQLPASTPLREVEFRVFSQWGEDGILQFLTSHMEIKHDIFIEFGVEDYSESNTRFLLLKDGWSGLVLDGSETNVQKIRQNRDFWRHDLQARCAFISPANINRLIQEAGIQGDIGVLSVDIDGNDYWVWKAIEGISPRIVICEYNSVFGPNHALTIPYQEDFYRTRAHCSNLYWGSSLQAFCRLGQTKGYTFVGSNRAGVNAFFVRNDLAMPFHHPTPEEGFVQSRFRESRNERGKLSFLRGAERGKAIESMELLDLDKGSMVAIRDLDLG